MDSSLLFLAILLKADDASQGVIQIISLFVFSLVARIICQHICYPQEFELVRVFTRCVMDRLHENWILGSIVPHHFYHAICDIDRGIKF